MVKLERPLNEYSKVNWGDHPETQEGRVIRVKSTSNLVSIISKLKDKQWEKIFFRGGASKWEAQEYEGGGGGSVC